MKLEEFIFQTYKDEVIHSVTLRKEIKDKFNLDDKTISNIFARINNYQIKKYGTRVYERSEFVTKEDILRFKKRSEKNANKNGRGTA